MTDAGERPGRGTATPGGEEVDRVDLQDRVVGVTSRAAAVRNGWLHRVAGVVCRDAGGRILVVRRSLRRQRFPGRLEALVAGAVKAGESYRAAAVREVREELGVVVEPRPVSRFLNLESPTPHWMGLFECRIPAVRLVADPAEIEEYAWHTLAAVRDLRGAGLLTPESDAVLSRIRH
ncbi:NUDIX domain-containing protein [Streptomyces sp. NPDC058735]|uniref:NUDIX domain-containing protein n=1 Tax=unclassified Streptomyces TaxID=2593676 RepID=UPI0036C82D01